MKQTLSRAFAASPLVALALTASANAATLDAASTPIILGNQTTTSADADLVHAHQLNTLLSTGAYSRFELDGSLAEVRPNQSQTALGTVNVTENDESERAVVMTREVFDDETERRTATLNGNQEAVATLITPDGSKIKREDFIKATASFGVQLEATTLKDLTEAPEGQNFIRLRTGGPIDPNAEIKLSIGDKEITEGLTAEKSLEGDYYNVILDHAANAEGFMQAFEALARGNVPVSLETVSSGKHAGATMTNTISDGEGPDLYDTLIQAMADKDTADIPVNTIAHIEFGDAVEGVNPLEVAGEQCLFALKDQIEATPENFQVIAFGDTQGINPAGQWAIEDKTTGWRYITDVVADNPNTAHIDSISSSIQGHRDAPFTTCAGNRGALTIFESLANPTPTAPSLADLSKDEDTGLGFPNTNPLDLGGSSSSSSSRLEIFERIVANDNPSIFDEPTGPDTPTTDRDKKIPTAVISIPSSIYMLGGSLGLTAIIGTGVYRSKKRAQLQGDNPEFVGLSPDTPAA